MIKSVILYLVLLFPVARLIAQEPVFRNFDVQKGKGQYFVVKPKNYGNLLQSLKIDSLIYAEFDSYQNNWEQNRDQYNSWKREMITKIVPEDIRKIVQQITNKNTKNYSDQFDIKMLIDKEGNILSVYFEIADNIINVVTENQIQNIYDALTNEKVTVMNALSMKKPLTKEQLAKLVEYMKDNMEELLKIKDCNIQVIYDRLGIKTEPIDYALIELAVGEYSLYKRFEKRMNSDPLVQDFLISARRLTTEEGISRNFDGEKDTEGLMPSDKYVIFTSSPDSTIRKGILRKEMFDPEYMESPSVLYTLLPKVTNSCIWFLHINYNKGIEKIRPMSPTDKMKIITVPRKFLSEIHLIDLDKMNKDLTGEDVVRLFGNKSIWLIDRSDAGRDSVKLIQASVYVPHSF